MYGSAVITAAHRRLARACVTHTHTHTHTARRAHTPGRWPRTRTPDESSQVSAHTFTMDVTTFYSGLLRNRYRVNIVIEGLGHPRPRQHPQVFDAACIAHCAPHHDNPSKESSANWSVSDKEKGRMDNSAAPCAKKARPSGLDAVVTSIELPALGDAMWLAVDPCDGVSLFVWRTCSKALSRVQLYST